MRAFLRGFGQGILIGCAILFPIHIWKIGDREQALRAIIANPSQAAEIAREAP